VFDGVLFICILGFFFFLLLYFGCLMGASSVFWVLWGHLLYSMFFVGFGCCGCVGPCWFSWVLFCELAELFLFIICVLRDILRFF